MAERLTYFMMISSTFYSDNNTTMTENSMRNEANVWIAATKNAGYTLVKRLWWFTAYFIIPNPFLISFSTCKCIIIEHINLTNKISTSSFSLGMYTLNWLSLTNNQMMIMREIYNTYNNNEFISTEDYCYAFSLSSPPFHSFLMWATKAIAAESGAN